MVVFAEMRWRAEYRERLLRVLEYSKVIDDIGS